MTLAFSNNQSTTVIHLLLLLTLLQYARPASSLLSSPFVAERCSLVACLSLSPQFYCFSKATIANFTYCEKPSRPPDMVSMGQSEYWDEGDSVIRYSHHWTGQNGVDTIKDSFWSLSVVHEHHEFVAGVCRYADFVRIKKKKQRRKPNRRR